VNDLVLSRIEKRFGEKVVLHDFSAVFPAGSATCVMGPSGCGKTTLLRILLGLETPDSGTVTGRPQRVSAVFQENRLFEGFSPLANVSAVCPGVSREVIRAHLTALGLEDSLSLPVRTLSGGMKRRVAIARAVLAPGDLLVLDEPFTGLDQDTKSHVLAYLRENTQGRTLVLVTHDPEEGAALTQRTLHLTPADQTGPESIEF
jgi:NitT/TauT family transport system ATP-binding protein